MEVERITIMKKLTNDEKEQIIIYSYEKGVDDYEYPQGVNATLEALGYEDKIYYDSDKEILVWSTIHDH